VLVSGHPRQEKLLGQVYKRLIEELTKLEVEVNVDKTKVVDLTKDESFSFLGFDFKRVRGKTGKWYPQKTPRSKKENRTTGQTQARVQKATNPGTRRRHIRNKPYNQRVGKLLPNRAFEPMFQLYKGLGRKESKKAPDESEETQGIRLEKVE
jgi:hypothetical protein